MLASINPLGERARNNRWGITVGWYLLGSAAAGAVVGTLLGLAGSLVVPASPPWVFAAVAVLAALGLAFDVGVGGLRLPTVHRQVNEAWLDRYRSWVYGLGFGVQLGTGVVTIVTTSAIYVAWAVAFLSSSPLVGGLVGLTFGAVRGSALLGARRAHRPDQLRELIRRAQRWAGTSGRLAVAALAASGVAAVAMAV